MEASEFGAFEERFNGHLQTTTSWYSYQAKSHKNHAFFSDESSIDCPSETPAFAGFEMSSLREVCRVGDIRLML